MYPGQFVGILPTGAVKPPENTKTGPHGRFIVIVHAVVSLLINLYIVVMCKELKMSSQFNNKALMQCVHLILLVLSTSRQRWA